MFFNDGGKWRTRSGEIFFFHELTSSHLQNIKRKLTHKINIERDCKNPSQAEIELCKSKIECIETELRARGLTK